MYLGNKLPDNGSPIADENIIQGHTSTEMLFPVKGKVVYSSLWKPTTELWSITCHMGSHSVTCHPTQVNVPHLNPSHAGRYLIYLPQRDGRLS